MRILFSVAFLILGSCSFLYSQNILSGKVTSEQNTPLDQCHIHAERLFAITNPDGTFAINDMPAGRQKLSISFLGFKPLDTIVEITGDLYLTIKLKVDISALNEIIITNESPEPGSNELRSSIIERYSNASLGDLLREIPGVSSLKTGNSIVKPVINGLHSSRVLIINNNVRLEDQQWGLEHSPNLDVNTAGKVSIVKGTSGLQYGGDAIGGIVLVEPMVIPLADTLFGRTIISGSENGRGGSITSSLFKGYQSGWNYNLQGTFKYLGDRTAPEYVLSNTGHREKNFSAVAGYKGENWGYSAFYSYYNATIGILRASHTGSSSDFANSIKSQIPSIIRNFTYDIGSPRQEVQHHLGKVDFYKNFGQSSKLEMQYTFQFNNRLEFDIRRGNNRNKASLDLNLMTQTFSAGVQNKRSRKLSYRYGVNAMYQNNFANTNTGIRPLIPNYNKYEAAVYGIAQLAASEKWNLDAGIRYDVSHIDATKFYLKSRWDAKNYDRDFSEIITGDFATQWKTNPVFTYHNFSGNLGSQFRISRSLSWDVNVGLTSRSPNPSELFSDGLHHATGQIEIGDLRLNKETAAKASTTIAFSGKKVAFEINPFVSLINDFTILIPTRLEETIRGTFPVWDYNQVDTRMAGLDFSVNVDLIKNVGLKTMGSYVYGKDLDNGTPLIDLPPFNLSNAVTYKNAKWNNLMVSLKSEIVGTQGRFPDNDFYTDIIINGEPVSTLVPISQPPKGYHLLHFISSTDFKIRKQTVMTVGLNVSNIFDTSYRDYLNRMRFYADELGRNISLQVKINY